MADMPTPITFSLTLPTGAPVTGGKAVFALSGYDLDGGIVIPAEVEAAISADGTGTVSLWPNVMGMRGTSYKVTVAALSGLRVDLGTITVPESSTPVPLHTIVPVGQIGGLKTLVMTQEQYDALDPKDAQTIYLIRAEG